MAKNKEANLNFFEPPRLRKDMSLSRDYADYFPGDPAEWPALSTARRDKHIHELCRHRCPFRGLPRAGETLKVVYIDHGKLDLQSGAEAPWSYVTLLSSPDRDRDMVSRFGHGAGCQIVHYDPLDEAAGFEAVDEEVRAFKHSELDFYLRASISQVESAEEWHHATVAAWKNMLENLHRFVLLAASGADYARTLGFSKPEEWMDAVGVYLPSYAALKKVIDHPAGLSQLWIGDHGISPFLLSKLMNKAGDDLPEWLEKAKTQACLRPELGGTDSSEVKTLLADLKAAFPPETTKHYFIFPRG